MSHDDLRHSGFKERTRVADAREQLRACVSPHGRTERVPLAEADARTLAAPIASPNPVPPAARAAMDGYAVRAEDTFGSSDRSPEVLRAADGDPTETTVGPQQALRVHTGSALPEGADAVVMVEQTETVGGDVEVFDAVAEGENVAPAGEDVEDGQHLYDAGHVLRPSDLGLLTSVGLTEVEVTEKPAVTVIPTGDELVDSDPGPGETIETNSLTIGRFVRRWGGEATRHEPVVDDAGKLRAAIESSLDSDLVVTSGGSSVGQRDLLPEVLADLGEMQVHGVALKPGHPFGFAVVDETPVLMLPGYPVASIINAVQFLRPAVKWSMEAPLPAFPTREATLERKIPSEPGVRTFARVRVESRAGAENGEATDGEATGEATDGEAAGETADGPDLVATPTRVSGSGVLSSVALADGWVVVPESVEGFDGGQTVAVQNWEWSA